MQEQKKSGFGRKLFQVVFWTLVLLTAALYGTTFRYSGDKGLARMSAEEKPWLAKAERVKEGMSYRQVVEILGEPSSGVDGKRPTWKVDGNNVNRIAVYFSDGKVSRVFWIHLGRFAIRL